MGPETGFLEGKKQLEEHMFAQCSENGLAVSAVGHSGCCTILWLDCIRVVRTTHDLVGLTWILS